VGLFTKEKKLKDLRTGQQIELGKSALEKVQQGVNAFTPGAKYTGQLQTDLSPLEKLSLNFATDFTNQDITGNQAYAAGKDQIMGTLAGRFDPNGPEAKALRATFERQQEKGIDTARRGQALRGAFRSSGALRQEGDIITDTNIGVNNALAALYSKERQNQLMAADKALGIGEAENQQSLQKAEVAGKFGKVERQNELDNIDRLYKDYLRERTEQGASLDVALQASNFGQPLLGKDSVTEQTALGKIFSALGGSVTSAAAGAVGGKVGDALFTKFFKG